MVRAHASRAEGLKFEPDSMTGLNAHSLYTQQQMDDDTGQIKVAKKRTGHPTSHADGSAYVSPLTGAPLRTIVYGTMEIL